MATTLIPTLLGWDCASNAPSYMLPSGGLVEILSGNGSGSIPFHGSPPVADFDQTLLLLGDD